ncbi:HK97 family phage prohead protease [Gordonia alkanivorans]|uniref:HK97 family phage prohead protease n=1 Tax=Gordonia alkanivorans TaxID=84096 RepID=UPI00244A9DD6|nr:HK97 family phage prohead protease [Gordonia alkanivorans]MDH3045348.1 HK97 family phage prohead protease [Gordonia alkanivorans]
MLKHKTLTLSGVKTAGLADGQFEGFASVFDHLDSQGDIVRRGAFAKSITGGTVVPLIWEHQSKDPRAFVGEVKSAEETSEGLKIVGQFDMDTDAGTAAYRQVKARRVGALSIGYAVRDQRKSADGAQELLDLDLMEISIVSRPANDRALIGAVKSNDSGTIESAIVTARAALAKAAGTAEAEDKPEQFYDDAATEKTHGERLLDALAAATASAEALISEAESEGRDLTEEEATEVTKRLDYITSRKSEVQAWADATPEERHGAQYLYDVLGSKALTNTEFEQRWGTRDTAIEKFRHFDASGVGITKTKAKEAPTVDTTDKFLTLGSGRKAAAATIANKMAGGGAGNEFQGGGLGIGTKALTTSGQVTTDVPVAPTVIPTGRPAVSLLDVIPTVRRNGPQYRYIRQISRALNAAAVAEGAEKPTSTMGTETVDGNVSVVAHLSEPLDKFVLADAPQLQRFVADELLYGLDVAIQAQVLTGTGVGANQTGILATSGVQVQTFDTSAIVSIRKAMTKAEALGYTPGVAVLRPEDWEAIELTATSDDAVAFRGVPIDLLERKIWGLRVVLNTALPAKTGLVLDPAAVSIDHLGQVDVEWDGSGDLFSHNQVQARVETRIGVSVYAPAAIYRVATAAA